LGTKIAPVARAEEENMSAKEDSLNFKEYGELALEGIIASIPSVGAALQTAYFGRKNEKRFKRIESFYNELSKDINKLHAQMATSEQIDSVSNELSDFMEATNDIIESQSSLAKRSMLHNAFLNILTSPESVDWSKSRFFMSTVSQIDMIDLKIMFAIQKIPSNRWAIPEEVERALSLDHFFSIGLLERLTNLGYLEKRLGSITMNENGTNIDTYYRITNLGNQFLDFVMNPPVSTNTQNSDN
jgi:hypothetical protein